MKGIYTNTGSVGGLVNLTQLRAMTNVQRVRIMELIFANDVALATRSEAAMQRRINRFTTVGREFGPTISLKK